MDYIYIYIERERERESIYIYIYICIVYIYIYICIYVQQAPREGTGHAFSPGARRPAVPPGRAAQAHAGASNKNTNTSIDVYMYVWIIHKNKNNEQHETLKENNKQRNKTRTQIGHISKRARAGALQPPDQRLQVHGARLRDRLRALPGGAGAPAVLVV